MTVLETGRAEAHLLQKKTKNGNGIRAHPGPPLPIIWVVPYTSHNLKRKASRVWVLDPGLSSPPLHQPALESSSEWGAAAENSKPSTFATQAKPSGAILQKKQDANSWEQQEISLDKRQLSILGGETVAPLPSSCLADMAGSLSIWSPNRAGIVAGVLCSRADQSRWHQLPCHRPSWAHIASNGHRDHSSPASPEL